MRLQMLEQSKIRVNKPTMALKYKDIIADISCIDPMEAKFALNTLNPAPGPWRSRESVPPLWTGVLDNWAEVAMACSTFECLEACQLGRDNHILSGLVSGVWSVVHLERYISKILQLSSQRQDVIKHRHVYSFRKFTAIITKKRQPCTERQNTDRDPSTLR